MDKVVKYLPLLLLLSLLLALVLGLQSFVLLYIVEPIAALLWAAWRIVLSVDQGVYWGLLIVVCSIAMIRVFASGHSGVAVPPAGDRHAPRTRVERWQALLADAAIGDFQHATLRDGLGDLLVSVIGLTEPSAPANLEEALASKRIALPAAAQRYLSTGLGGGNWQSKTQGLHLLRLAPRWLRLRVGYRADPDHVAIRELLESMESFMEMNHDR